MSSLEEIRASRLAKIKILQDKGINPYPVSSSVTHSLAVVSGQFEKLSKDKSRDIILAGRVTALRGQGGLVFCDLFDGTGRFQTLLKRDVMNESDFAFWGETVDIGDFVEVSGSLFITKKNEKTLQVKEWKMLSKSLRPLPEKWQGLQDVEERFRRRYLDLIMNEETRRHFILRSRIISALRMLLEREGFLEVETSLLQPLAGGANAEPFKTHHNALDIDLYLRVAPELDLKKLLIGGFSKVYEIGKSFRNEGIDVTHNPEFTTVEWYEAYSDATKQRAFVEKIIRGIVSEVIGGTLVSFAQNEIDFGKPFVVVNYFDALERYALIPNPQKATREELSLKATQLGVKVDPADSKEKILDSIYKKTVRPKLIQPTFIVGYPKNYIPLAKGMEDDSEFVDAFQAVIGGMEMVKAFSELNDPIEQAKRFIVEDVRRKEGDKEAQPNDNAFVEALEYGMPPAGGVGMGIERLVMLLANVKNIREVILFPTLRPKNSN